MVASLFNLVFYELIYRICEQLSLTLRKTELGNDRLDSKLCHYTDLFNLCSSIRAQKIVDIRDIMFEFRKISYYYKYYGAYSICKTTFCILNTNKSYSSSCLTYENVNKTDTEISCVWISAHFPFPFTAPFTAPNDKTSVYVLASQNCQTLYDKGCDFYDQKNLTFESNRACYIDLTDSDSDLVEFASYLNEIEKELLFIKSEEDSSKHYSEFFNMT